MSKSSQQKSKKTNRRRVPATFLALNPYPIIEIGYEGKLYFANDAAEAAFPDLKQKRLEHPLFEGWQTIFQTLSGKTHNLRREIQIYENWFIEQFFLVPGAKRIRLYLTPINELKHAQQALEKEKNILQTVMNGSEIIHLVYLDRDFNFVKVNETYAKGCGYSPEEMIGKNHFQLFPHHENEAIFRKVRDTGEPIEFKDKPFIFKDQPQRGVTYWDWTLKPVKNEDKQVEGLVFSLIETTERKHNQIKLIDFANNMETLAEERAKQLSQAERLATIGQTAGMVGHDIRNPLQAIAGELYLCRDEAQSFPDEQPRKNILESLQSIEQNLFYIDKIVADLQDFTKILNPNWESVNIEHAIEEAMLIVTIPNNLKVNINIQQNFPPLKADQAMLKRALTNLIQNAVQAMPDGGNLQITAHHTNSKAEINITDTGDGIPLEIQPKLFTPLFTTKSKGQGFGLAVTKRLIEAQNGNITFQTNTGKGTTFTIQLPTKQNK
jgi:PAS domain S-box-containing protein